MSTEIDAILEGEPVDLQKERSTFHTERQKFQVPKKRVYWLTADDLIFQDDDGVLIETPYVKVHIPEMLARRIVEFLGEEKV